MPCFQPKCAHVLAFVRVSSTWLEPLHYISPELFDIALGEMSLEYVADCIFRHRTAQQTAWLALEHPEDALEHDLACPGALLGMPWSTAWHALEHCMGCPGTLHRVPWNTHL